MSWEYASTLELWKIGRPARTHVRAVLRARGHEGRRNRSARFRRSRWWGKDLFGIDNALVGDWPVVVIVNGKARIQEFGSIADWWSKHQSILVKHMRALNLMWDQREHLAASAETPEQMTAQDFVDHLFVRIGHVELDDLDGGLHISPLDSIVKRPEK